MHVSEQSTGCFELARGSGSGTLEEDGKSGKLAVQGTYRLPWTHWLHLLRPQCKAAGRRSVGRSHQSSRSTSPQRQLQATPLPRLFRSPRQLLLWIAFLSDSTVHAVPDPVMEPVPMEYVSPAPAVYVASARVVEHIAPAPTPVTVAKHTTPAPAVYAHLFLWRSTSLQHQRQVSQCQRLHRFLSWNTFPQLLQGMPHQLLWLSSSLQRQWQALPRQCLQCVLQLLSWNISPDPAVCAAHVPVVEHIAPALAASYGVPAPTAFAAPAPVVEHISPDLAEYAVAEYITPSRD